MEYTILKFMEQLFQEKTQTAFKAIKKIIALMNMSTVITKILFQIRQRCLKLFNLILLMTMNHSTIILKIIRKNIKPSNLCQDHHRRNTTFIAITIINSYKLQQYLHIFYSSCASEGSTRITFSSLAINCIEGNTFLSSFT